MATYLHTMLRITDPEQSRSFYEALGFRFSRGMDIVRNGELEATNYFYSLGDDENVLELTFNHDGRTYELGTGYDATSVCRHWAVIHATVAEPAMDGSDLTLGRAAATRRQQM